MLMGKTQSGRPCARGFTKTYEWHRQILNLDFFFLRFIYLAVLGLYYCTQAVSSCRGWELLFIEVRWFLLEVASVVVEHGL